MFPRATFSEKDIQALELEFRETKQVRGDCAALADKEPPEAVNDALQLAQWVIQNLPFLKSKKAEIDVAKTVAGASLGAAMLGKAEADELNVTSYLSAMMLDVDRYLKAVASSNQQQTDLKDRWVELRNQHVKAVKQFQANQQNTEVVFWASEEKKKLSARRNWLDKAVRSANAHRRVIRTVLNVREEDICQVNAFPLYTMGTKKKKRLDAIKLNLP